MKTRVIRDAQGCYKIEKKPWWSPMWLRVYGYRSDILAQTALDIAQRLSSPVVKEFK